MRKREREKESNMRKIWEIIISMYVFSILKFYLLISLLGLLNVLVYE